MKTVPLELLKSNELNVSEISAIRQTNLWSTLSHSNGRIFNGFLLLLDGHATFSCEQEVTELSPGGLIYLPKGARHTVSAREKSLDFYRINFTVRSNATNEEIVFSKKPMLITENSPKPLIDTCEQMRKATVREDSGFAALGLLCNLFDFCTKLAGSSAKTKIGAAIDYINIHYTEQISVSELASRTFMSEAQLFRLFKKEIGLSPIEYKNELRIKKAEALLCDPECTVGEIATILGFDNPCYFSRLFKKARGKSPAEFKKDVLGA